MKINTFEETVTLPSEEKCALAIALTMHFLSESFNLEHLYQSAITTMPGQKDLFVGEWP